MVEATPSIPFPNIGAELGPAFGQLGQTLGNLPEIFRQAQLQQAQVDAMNALKATPLTDASGNVNYGAIAAALAKSGDVKDLWQVLPLYQAQQGQQAAMSALTGGPPAASSAAWPRGQGATADPRGLVPYIRDTAAKYGIDPNTAVAVARSEGLTDPVGDRGASFGAFQLYTRGGVGNDFQRDTGLDPRDPANEKATIDYALRRAAQGGWGPWEGAKKIGLGQWTGINRQRGPVQGDTVADMVGNVWRGESDVGKIVASNISRALNIAPNAPLPPDKKEIAQRYVENYARRRDSAPEPARRPAPPPEQAPAQAEAPRGGLTPEALRRSAGATAAAGVPLTPTQQIGAEFAALGAPSPSGGAVTPPARIVSGPAPPIGPRATPGEAAPATAPPPAAAAAPAAQPGPYDAELQRLVPDAYTSRGITAERYRDILSGIAAQVPPQAQAPLLERVRRIDDLLARRAEAQLREQELTPEEKAAKRADMTPLEYERTKERSKEEVKRYEKLDSGVQGIGATAASNQANINLQRQLVNDPDFYSGTGANAALYLKRAFPAFAGSAAPMELYRKVLNKNMLDTINTMRGEAVEMGGTSQRIFSAQIGQIEAAAGGLDNSVTGLRALAELNYRANNRSIQIADFATAYKARDKAALPAEFTRQWPPPHLGELDANFERGLRDWYARNPMLTADEQRDARVLGAPTFNSREAVIRAHPPVGSPVRMPNGAILYITPELYNSPSR